MVRELLFSKAKDCPSKLQELNYEVFFIYICLVKRDDGLYFSYSCYEGKKTGLTYLFTSFGELESEVFKLKVSKAFWSLRKTIQQAAHKEGTKQQPGKYCMTYSAYNFTCVNLINSGLPVDIFCLYFLML